MNQAFDLIYVGRCGWRDVVAMTRRDREEMMKRLVTQKRTEKRELDAAEARAKSASRRGKSR